MSGLLNREKRLCAILCNTVIVMLEVVAAVITTAALGVTQFQYYTQDSNYFAMIVSILFLVIACRTDREKPLPQWVVLLRYMATCLLSVTFLVVIFILSPIGGINGYYTLLFTGSMPFEHLLCPLLSFFSLILFEEPPKLKSASLFALIPTLLYAAVAVPLNVAKIWHGPYPFFYVYEQPWWQSVLFALIIPIGAYMVAFVLVCGMKKAQSKRIKS